MPVRIIGMIGVAPPTGTATLHVIEGGPSPGYLTEFARAHDDAGFDLAHQKHRGRRRLAVIRVKSTQPLFTSPRWGEVTLAARPSTCFQSQLKDRLTG
jgi:hypothetical protein